MRAEVERPVEESSSRSADERHLLTSIHPRHALLTNKLADDPNFWTIRRRPRADAGAHLAWRMRFPGIGKVARGLDDVGMIELGEAEGEEGVSAEAETALKALRRKVAAPQLEALLRRLDPTSSIPYRLVSISCAGAPTAYDWPHAAAIYSAGPKSTASSIDIWRSKARTRHKRATIQIRAHNAMGWLKTEGRRALGWWRYCRSNSNAQPAYLVFERGGSSRCLQPRIKNRCPPSPTFASTPCVPARRRPHVNRPNPRCG